MPARRDPAKKGKHDPKARVFRSVDDYERLMQKPDEDEDADALAQEIRGGLAAHISIREGLSDEDRLS